MPTDVLARVKQLMLDGLSRLEMGYLLDVVLFNTMFQSNDLESQLSHKTVNLLFQLVKISNRLTILWSS